MSTNAIIGIVVAVVVVGGGIWYFTSSSSGSSAPTNSAADTTGNENAGTNNGASTGSGTFASMMGMSGSYKCTVTSKDPSTFSGGTVYISNGNMRSDFTSTSEGKNIDVHMIKNGSDIYTWTSAYPQGMKMSASMMTNPQPGAASGQSFNANTSVDYSCVASSADASMFVAPSSIKFMDVSAMMQVK